MAEPMTTAQIIERLEAIERGRKGGEMPLTRLRQMEDGVRALIARIKPEPEVYQACVFGCEPEQKCGHRKAEPEPLAEVLCDPCPVCGFCRLHKVTHAEANP